MLILIGFFPDVRVMMTTATIFMLWTYYEPQSFIQMSLHYGFTHINSIKPHSHSMNRYHCYFHFIDKKLSTEGLDKSCLLSFREEVPELGE